MIVTYLSLALAIVGAFVYVGTANAKVGELGRLLFWCGMLAFLLHFGALRVP